MSALTKSYLSLIAVFTILAYCVSCSSSESVPADVQITQIDALMQEMFDYSSKPDMRPQSDSVMNLLRGRYDRFVVEYPEHEMAPVFLDRAANIARNKKDYKAALDYYSRIVKEYPNSENIVDTKFLIAFVYDTELNDKEKAREQYEAVANEYPDHILGRNAKQRLQNLHMSDKELIESFEKQNKLAN